MGEPTSRIWKNCKKIYQLSSDSFTILRFEFTLMNEKVQFKE